MKKIIKFLTISMPLALGLNSGNANALTVDAGTLTSGSLYTNWFSIPSTDNDGIDFFDSITFSILDTLSVRVFADNVPDGFSFARVDLISGAPAFTFITQDTTLPIDFTQTLAAGNYQVNFKYPLGQYPQGEYLGGVSVAAVPEPETYAMLLAGLGMVGFMARRRKA